jgi:GNAT superfamily N-acetyltransferase
MGDPSPTQIRLSELDERRWGVRTAIASVVTPADAAEALAFCDREQVELLVARCAAEHLETVHTLEEAGGRLMDTLVYFSRELRRLPIPEDTGTTSIRRFEPGDADRVREIAAQAFAGYIGHYHADPRLPQEACDAVYTDWAARSCAGEAGADEVLVSELDGRVVGFATLRLNSDEEGEGVLFAVAPEAQGIGIYRSLMIAAMSWFLEAGCERMVTSSQITNRGVQKVWVRLGAEPTVRYYTLHRWAT